jgi:hypothetical protein
MLSAIRLNRFLRAVLCPAVLLTLTATAIQARQTPRDPTESDTILGDRVTQYWTARSQANLVAAYPFYEPEFRAAYSLEQFLSSFQRLMRFRPQFTGIDRVAFEPGGSSAKVTVRLRTQPDVLDGAALDSLSEETWLRIEGVWYRQREATTMTF